MDIVIRKETIQDVEKQIDIVRTEWWSTYRGLIPDELIEKFQYKNQERIDKAIKNIQENDNAFVAIVNNEVVGVSSYGKSRDENYPNSSEIYSCYVLDEYHDMKIGRMLADKVMETLLEQGYQTMITRCLVGNPFNAWHKALGGKFNGTAKINLMGYEFTENVYYHKDLQKSYEENKNKIKMLNTKGNNIK